MIKYLTDMLNINSRRVDSREYRKCENRDLRKFIPDALQEADREASKCIVVER